MDFDVLARTLPGVTRLDPVDGDTAGSRSSLRCPPSPARTRAPSKVVGKTPDRQLRLRGEAEGNARLGRGRRPLRAERRGEATHVSSTMSFQTGGVLSGVGQRFMEGIAKSMMRQFFKAFERELELALRRRPQTTRRGGRMKISAQFMPGDLPVFTDSVRKAEEAGLLASVARRRTASLAQRLRLHDPRARGDRSRSRSAPR